MKLIAYESKYSEILKNSAVYLCLCKYIHADLPIPLKKYISAQSDKVADLYLNECRLVCDDELTESGFDLWSHIPIEFVKTCNIDDYYISAVKINKPLDDEKLDDLIQQTDCIIVENMGAVIEVSGTVNETIINMSI